MRVMLIDQIAKVNYKYTYPMANGLYKAGADVELVIDLKQEAENCQCPRLNLFNTDEKNISKVAKLKNYISSYRRLCKKLSKGNYDIVHTQWYTFSPIDYYYLRKMKKRFGVRYVATVHDILPFNQKPYDMFFHKKLYALADAIILQAPGNVKRFADLFPESAAKTHMIPHGHMLDYVETRDKQASREKLGLPRDKKIFLFFGQIKKVKGVDVLLKAVAKLRSRYPELYTVVAGSVWKADFTECEQIIASEKLDDCVHTDIRYIPDEEVADFYSAADACVLPYTDVYQSGVIQLAYGYRKAVVATALPAFTQFVKEEETGFIAEPGDPDSLADALEKALQASDLDALGQKGYELVDRELNWDMLSAKIVEECYQS